MRTLKLVWFLCFCFITYSYQINAGKENSLIKLGRVKYSGGGDWYNDPSAEVNLLKYIKQHTNIPIEPIYTYVDLQTDNLFMYPILFLTGHGSINLTDQEVEKLRAYLTNGGFLYIDDDYGLDEFVRREIKKIFPDLEFKELPFNYGLFHCHYSFENGVPKTHEHDDKPPQSFGIFYEERLCVLLTFESNPSDGWVDSNIYNDSEDKREEALKFGTNVVIWALGN